MATTPERPHTLSLRVSQEELDWLRAYGEREERSISWVLRLALKRLLEERRDS